VDRSVAQGRGADGSRDRAAGPWTRSWSSTLIGGAILLVALGGYAIWNPLRFYNHFVWQADAFLHGETSIQYPVEATADNPGNAFFNDVLPVVNPDGTETGRGIVPFPPLPAVVLLPFVALWGLNTDQQLIAIVLGVLDVGLCWWMVGRLRVRGPVRFATTLFFAFGTVFWFTAMLGTTWWFAHIVALIPLFLAVGLAVTWDPASRLDEDALPDQPPARRPMWWQPDTRQFLAGFLFGLAGTARLTVLFGAPFFVLVGSGGSWQRRALSAGLGAAIPVLALLVYNLASTGHLFNPAYDALYQAEAYGYPTLGYHGDWSIEDPRYIPQNLGIMLFGMPALFPTQIPAALGDHGALCVEPGVVRTFFDINCPIALPRDTGMSLLLTSPAYLLAIPALRLHGRARLVTGAVLAVVLIAFVNLMHFSQGWVQFGYRFSNDFVPFALLLVAVGLERRGRVGLVAASLLAVSVAVNFWGVYWGNALGW
jgi:hypothetical protein